jgi:hypothetical protein
VHGICTYRKSHPCFPGSETTDVFTIFTELHNVMSVISGIEPNSEFKNLILNVFYCNNTQLNINENIS